MLKITHVVSNSYALIGWLVCLWSLTPLSTILSYIAAVSFIGEETEVPGENNDMSQVTDKPFHIILYRVHLAMHGVRTHNFCGDRHLLHR